MSHLPGNLYILRKHRKLQQDGMQEALGISRATWSNYENGKTEPSIQTLLEIAAYFAVSLDDLLRNDLSQHKDWQQVTPVGYQHHKVKKGLQSKDSSQEVNESHTDQQQNLMQEILEELKAIRKHIIKNP